MGKAVADGRTRRQVGALPFRIEQDGAVSVLLITSRETRRWIVPKGWPAKGLKDHEAAAKEAFEEAGIIGDIEPAPLGAYDYWKRCVNGFELCEVFVFPLLVRDQATKWPEKGQRDLRWLAAGEACLAVEEPGLKVLIGKLARLESVTRGATPESS